MSLPALKPGPATNRSRTEGQDVVLGSTFPFNNHGLAARQRMMTCCRLPRWTDRAAPGCPTCAPRGGWPCMKPVPTRSAVPSRFPECRPGSAEAEASLAAESKSSDRFDDRGIPDPHHHGSSSRRRIPTMKAPPSRLPGRSPRGVIIHVWTSEGIYPALRDRRPATAGRHDAEAREAMTGPPPAGVRGATSHLWRGPHESGPSGGDGIATRSIAGDESSRGVDLSRRRAPASGRDPTYTRMGKGAGRLPGPSPEAEPGSISIRSPTLAGFMQ